MLSCNFSVNVGWFRHMLGSQLAQLDIMLMVRLVLCVCVCFVQDTLSAIGESLPSLVFQPLLKRKQVSGFLEEEVRYPKESLACLAHLVFVHHLAADTFPGVFR